MLLGAPPPWLCPSHLVSGRLHGIHICPRGLSPVAHSGQCQRRPFTAVLSSCSHVIFLQNKFPASESAEVSAKTKREILARGRKGAQLKATEVLPHPQVWQGSWNCQLAFKKVCYHIEICLLFMYLFICVYGGSAYISQSTGGGERVVHGSLLSLSTM